MADLKTLLRSAREARGWSLQEAANIIGSTKGHLHDLESGRADNPTLRLVAALVIAYGIRPEALIATVAAAAPGTTPDQRDWCTDPDNCGRCKAPTWDQLNHSHAGIPQTPHAINCPRNLP